MKNVRSGQSESMFSDDMKTDSAHTGSTVEPLLGYRILDDLPVACFMLDLAGKFLAGNTSFLELVSASPDTYQGKNPYLQLAPDDADRLTASDAELLEAGGVVSHDGYITTGTGEIKPVVYKKTVIHRRDGEKSGLLVSLLDLSELDAVKNALHTSESEKQAILDGFPGVLCLFNADEKAIWVNDRVHELHPNPVGKSCHELFCRTEKSCRSCAVPKSLVTGEIHSTIQRYNFFTEGGEERIYEMTGTPVKNNAGEVVSVVVIGRDVTKRHMLEKQLRHTQKMEAIGTLAGGIAHDFNNVLTPIMGYSEIIRLKLKQNNDQDQMVLEYLDGILAAARRAKSLVEQVLTFSRSSEQKESLQYIHPIVKEVMKLMRVTLPSTINIEEHIDEHCGMSSVDPVQIHQILINLCTNSSHAMEGEHGTLRITLTSCGKENGSQKWLRLSVADTGCGIEKEKLERIFEPYYTTKEKSRGTGMGLAMVHGIVTRQGGRIEVQSELGKGTTFDLYLPVSEELTRIDQIINTSEYERGTGRILLVDDEAQVVQVTGELLISLGYTVTGRTSAYDALSLFATSPHDFDLVLTDLTMPELTGVELSRKIKELRDDVPVVLFTGYSESLSRDAANEAGIAEYCMKPVSLRNLSEIIRKTLELPIS